MDSADISGMLTGVAAIIGAIAALMTAIVAFKNAKKPTTSHGIAQPVAPTQPQYVQGIPNAIQPKRNVSTWKLFLRFVIAGALLIAVLVWFNSLYDYESTFGYVLTFAILGLFVLTGVYGIRLLYRLLRAVFLH